MDPETKNLIIDFNDWTIKYNTFVKDIDSWIKQIRGEFSEFKEIPIITAENQENIQHNYELIYDLKDQVEELKQEIHALKLLQLISLKKGVKDAKLHENTN